jgi:O-antigen ligase/Flp pilus assembly protein TadD
MNDFLRVIVYGGLFAVPFLTMFVVNDYFFPFITGKNFAFRIIVEVVLVAWVLLMLVDAKYRPKFSWLLVTFSGFLGVMFFANLFGEHPATSFWSNFERMDGYVTLVHVFLYALVLGSVLTTKKLWGSFLHTTLGVSFVVALYGMSQYAGGTEAGYTGRMESFLGNAAYFAIYMYFHIFIAFWLFVESRSSALRAMYALLIALFVFALFESGTRGTVIGLVAGIVVMVSYIALFGAKYPEFRRYAIGAFAALIILGGAFYSVRDSAFVQQSGSLSRIANIDLASDLVVRGTIWGMAWEGVKERPVLGWGQGNFNYVFNREYDPSLYGQEQWFDRVHNIFFDWLVAGGVLGLIGYMSIFGACLYYLVWVPLRRPEDQTFTVLERGVLLGILAGYITHNLVVFDNIVSYIFFAVILALIHARVGTPIVSFEKLKVDTALFNQFLVPVGAIVVVVLVYTLHLPGMQAASDIIAAYRVTTPADKLAAFERALDRGSFAHQEITEQISQQAMGMMRDPQVTEEVRQKFVARAEQELNKLVTEKPGDARVHVFFSTFYRTIGDLEAAEREIARAQELSPGKPSIIMQRAINKYSQQDMQAARDYFREAFLLEEKNDEAREFYAGTLFLTGEGNEAKALITDERVFNRFAQNDFVVSSVNTAGDMPFLAELYTARTKLSPTVAQNWASLSFIYYQAGDNAKAIETLTQAGVAAPTFAKTAQCFITNIEAGKEPQEGC